MLSENEKGGKKRSAHCVDNSQFNSPPPKKKSIIGPFLKSRAASKSHF